MRYLVAYDVASAQSGANRLRKVANICQAFGERLQYSLFEVRLSEKELAQLEVQLRRVIVPNIDQIRIMQIATSEDRHIVFGIIKEYSLDKPLIL
jgi:CRISPR-associated protein Cas2